MIENIKRNSLWTTLKSIDHAIKDPKIVGVYMKIQHHNLGIAQIQELRQKLEKFKKEGKFIYSYASSFGYMSGGTLDYYLSAMSHKIYMQPLGTLALTGLAAERPFLKKIMADYGIEPQIYRRGAYKSAPETYTHDDFSAENKESLKAILDNLQQTFVSEIAQNRSISDAVLKQHFHEGPFLDHQALERKLVDGTIAENDIYEEIANFINEKKDKDAKIKVDDIQWTTPALYERIVHHHQKHGQHSKDKIALVFAQGEISEDSGSFMSAPDHISQSLAEHIDTAADDKNIKAIVLRVDSPGGSVTVSETIWHSVKNAKSKKPVVVSMGNYAASGGYYIACPATKIVAQAGTITGSIGVFSGKIVINKLLEKHGINMREIATDWNANAESMTKEFSPQMKEKVDLFLDHVYKEFTQKVMDGRQLSADKVNSFAQGRAMTGLQAKELGLVDEIGGMELAIEIAKKEAQLSGDPEIVIMPRHEKWWQFVVDSIEPEAKAALNYAFQKILFQNFSINEMTKIKPSLKEDRIYIKD